MIIPSSIEEIASYVEQDGKKVFVFSGRLVWGLSLPQALFAGD